MLRWYDGAVYRIGEIAEIAHVSKRTIDYYTSIGLLKAERSKSNYRIYSDDSLEDLKFIEECKSLHYPLDEIRRKLEMRKAKNIRESEVDRHVSAVTQQMKQLHSDLFDLIPVLENLDEHQKEKLMNNLSLLRNALKTSLMKVTS
ncbi:MULTISPECIES: MerR family transcriptional regulator [Bacillaceae]|jgi:MerR family transcriptional regulator, copper efflux regulator|uniref:MerR family transcriptional regulator n=1 Tax=Bacillaceae TaxID=186817 RepID=UPI0027DF9DB6|nr:MULTISPECIES: MerR family transcriptional regulator [Bacillaceae]MDR6124690.1 MerR family copper efflux transcriptional regulator [Bacillus sp. SLBN-46]WML57274.1 MerR family transcriptional regulator [Neobacillus sp. PS2-9]